MARPRHYEGCRPLRICWSGMHIGSKALPILLHALDRCQSPLRVELSVLGEGPSTEGWKRVAGSLTNRLSVRWPGRLDHNSALSEMNRADVFAFPSLQEATSTVVMEALAMGLPVLCHDACGMGKAVTSECGIKIPLVDPETSIRGFSAALDHLMRNPKEVFRLSQGALRRARELTWDAKVERMLNVYEQILEHPDPSFDESVISHEEQLVEAR